MKRSLAIVLVALLAFVSLSSCGKKTSAPKAGSAKAEDMLNLLPKDSAGVIIVDVNRIMQTEAVSKAIRENENYQKYQEIVQATGIDPQKDIYYLVGAVSGGLGQDAQEGAAIVNLKYEKEKLLSMLKQAAKDMTEAEYNGFTIYQVVPEEGEKPMNGAFLDESNIILGTDIGVRKVIDVYQKTTENIWKNENLPALLKGMNTSAMVWGGFAVPADAAKEATSENPMLAAFSDIRSIIVTFDYKDKNVMAEIKAMSPDGDKNKNMADALNGFKAMGAMAASKEPELGELMNRIEIVSAADHVKISAVIPEALIESLGQKAMKQKEEGEEND
jgi:hypothetical protein